MARRFTTKVFIERAKKVHGDKYDYSKVEYKKALEKICIICLKHGEFYQTPNDHVNGGRGCPKCAQENRRFSQFLSTGEFIERAKRVHGDKYDYSKVNYISSKVKVLIYCNKCGNNFWQTPSDHLQGKGCSECKRLLCLGPRKTTNDFIVEAVIVHGDKYNYDKVNYLGWNNKVLIHCNECANDFYQTPNNHLRGKGCPKCGFKVTSEQVNKMISTRLKNNNWSSSEMQNSLYCELVNFFNVNDVFKEYNEDERYPFHCDFYIKSQDLFIELNGFWTHNDHWFEENDIDDLNQVNKWQLKEGEFYKNAIETWTIRDVKKRGYARKNNLNYVVLWNDKDIVDWFVKGCPIRQDWK